MSGLIRPCQLPQERQYYVWCYVYDDDYDYSYDGENRLNYIHIMPENFYHWNGNITPIIGKIEGIKECLDGLFEYTDDKDILQIMNNAGIRYSIDAQDEIDMKYGTNCNCIKELPPAKEGYCNICKLVH
jgi:hypothetical protein